MILTIFRVNFHGGARSLLLVRNTFYIKKKEGADKRILLRVRNVVSILNLKVLFRLIKLFVFKPFDFKRVYNEKKKIAYL